MLRFLVSTNFEAWTRPKRWNGENLTTKIIRRGKRAFSTALQARACWEYIAKNKKELKQTEDRNLWHVLPVWIYPEKRESKSV